MRIRTLLLLTLAMTPLAVAVNSTSFQLAISTAAINSLQTRYLIVGTADGNANTIDTICNGIAIRQPSYTHFVMTAIELFGAAGSRSTNPLVGSETVSWQLRELVISGNTCVDNGLITSLITVTSATVFPFRSNITTEFDVGDKILYVQETPSTLVLPRTFTRSFRFDAVHGDWLNASSPLMGNFTGNVTGNFTGNVTFTELNGMIETAFDPYIEIVLFGLLLILFLRYEAWIAAIMALLAIGESILPTDVWRLEASVMFICVGLILEAIVAWRFGHYDFRRRPRQDR